MEKFVYLADGVEYPFELSEPDAIKFGNGELFPMLLEDVETGERSVHIANASDWIGTTGSN